MKKVIKFLKEGPASFFLVAALFWMMIMNVLNSKMGIQWKEIWIEANGMAFDLLVFGILLSIYESNREKKDKIARLHEEIDDYRGWNETEAMYRIVGAIKRLHSMNEHGINLHNAYLSKANLQEVNLQGVNLANAVLAGANLQGANLQGANLQDANLQDANLQGANLQDANLQGANLAQANLKGANFTNANLNDTMLSYSSLEGCIFFKASLKGVALDFATAERTWFESLEQWQVIGREEIKSQYQISNGVLIS